MTAENTEPLRHFAYKDKIFTSLRLIGLSTRASVIGLETYRAMVKSKKFLFAVLYFLISILVDAFSLTSQLIVEKNDAFAMFKAQQLIFERMNNWWFSTLGLLVIVVLSSDLISGEIERDTLHALYAKPVTEGEIILGKFMGTSLAFATILAPSLLITFYMQAITFGASWSVLQYTVDEVLYYLLIIILMISALVSLSLLFSVLTSKTLQSALLAFIFVIGGPIIALLLGFSVETTDKLTITYYGTGSLKKAMFNLEFQDFTWDAYVYFLILFALPLVFLALSTLALTRKEIP